MLALEAWATQVAASVSCHLADVGASANVRYTSEPRHPLPAIHPANDLPRRGKSANCCPVPVAKIFCVHRVLMSL